MSEGSMYAVAAFYGADGRVLGQQAINSGATLRCEIPPGAVMAEVSAEVREPPAPEPEPQPSGFLALVLAWLREHADPWPEPVAVERVAYEGSDWEGDTDAGFYSSFGCEIEWADRTGMKRRRQVDGEDLASLWDYVTRAWPEPASC